MTIVPPAHARTDDEVLALILAAARADPRVRAVVLSGSRADPAAPADAWRDFDVVYVVRDVAPFRADPAWIDVFGERTILQRPDAMLAASRRDDGGEAYLMLFRDGHRIDLTLLPAAAMVAYRHDGPAAVLLDLDGVVPAPPPAGEPHHVPDPPTARAFADVCNEFWWVAPYVAKGLARGELTYARHHLDTVLRAQLLTMLGWEVAAASGFRRGPGKAGRDLRRALPPATWSRLEATYADAAPANGWAALEAMTALFRTVAVGVAARCGFPYPRRDDERVTAHLRRMRARVGMDDDRPDPLVAELEGELAAWEALLTGRAERELRAPRSAGGWSVHDVVAHLAAWQQVSNARFDAALGGGSPTLPGWLAGGGPEDDERLQAYNDRIFAAQRGRPWPGVHRAWRAGFLQLIRSAAAAPPADLHDAARYPWLGGHPLAAVLEGTLTHHREHREAVTGWLADERAAGGGARPDGA